MCLPGFNLLQLIKMEIAKNFPFNSGFRGYVELHMLKSLVYPNGGRGWVPCGTSLKLLKTDCSECRENGAQDRWDQRRALVAKELGKCTGWQSFRMGDMD